MTCRGWHVNVGGAEASSGRGGKSRVNDNHQPRRGTPPAEAAPRRRPLSSAWSAPRGARADAARGARRPRGARADALRPRCRPLALGREPFRVGHEVHMFCHVDRCRSSLVFLVLCCFYTAVCFRRFVCVVANSSPLRNIILQSRLSTTPQSIHPTIQQEMCSATQSKSKQLDAISGGIEVPALCPDQTGRTC